MRISVLSVGGSIIAPDKVNSAFLSDFLAKIRTYLEDNPQDKLIFVCGGGAPARVYQQAYREVISDAQSQDSTPLGLVHWKRASSPVEAGTAGYL